MGLYVNLDYSLEYFAKLGAIFRARGPVKWLYPTLFAGQF